jgi:hypothetical protein
MQATSYPPPPLEIGILTSGVCSSLILAEGMTSAIPTARLHWPVVQFVSSTLKLTGCLGLNASNADKLSLELEDRVGWDRSHTPSTVSPIRLDGQCPLLAGAHVQESLVPSLDDLALADVEGERLAAVVAGVELGAIGIEGAAVVNVDLVTWRLFVSMLPSALALVALTALGLPSALDGLGDLDVKRLVQCRGGAEEQRER